jgi:hypothetical protein
MRSADTPHRFEPELLPCALVAVLTIMLAFALQAHVGLAPQEEGYLWYGVDALSRGEWPMRDFRAYDPGRYLWCAALSPLFGGGLIGTRAACACFGAIGICAGLLVVRSALPSRAWLVAAAAVLVPWAFPHWRPFEWGTSLVLTYAALKLFEVPSARRSFLFGVTTGLAAFFGRNHGLYAVLAFVLVNVIVLVARQSDPARTNLARRALAWIGGTFVGYLPMLALIAFVPGFAKAFVDSVLFFVGRSGLNIAYPATWPWTIDFERLHGIELAAAIALSAFFLLYVVGYLTLGHVAFRGRLGHVARHPALVGALCVGLPYVHHVAERSDIHHVAESIHPLLVGVLALLALALRRTWALAAAFAALIAASLLAIGTEQPLGRRWLARGTPREFAELEIGGAHLRVDGVVARRIDTVRRAIRAHVPDGDELLLSTKLLPLYPDLDRASPVWDIYPSWTADDAHQERMQAELGPVRWVFLQDVAVGGDEERRLASTYPRVWETLQREFERLATPDLPDNFVFLRRR